MPKMFTPKEVWLLSKINACQAVDKSIINRYLVSNAFKGGVYYRIIIQCQELFKWTHKHDPRTPLL